MRSEWDIVGGSIYRIELIDTSTMDSDLVDTFHVVASDMRSAIEVAKAYAEDNYGKVRYNLDCRFCEKMDQCVLVDPNR